MKILALLLCCGLVAAADHATAPAEQSPAMKRFTDARTAYEAAARAMTESANDALKDFARTMDLTPIPNAIPENPTGEQLRAAKRIADFNDQMKMLADQPREALVKNESFIKSYADLRGTPWILDVLVVATHTTPRARR